MSSTAPSTARRGIISANSEPYDAVILDIGLPKMDGISVLEAWRRTGRAMPVLMLTARDRWSDKVQGFDAGADDYVAKPFHLEEVLARVRALLRRSAGHAKSEFVCGPVRLDTRTGRVAVDGNPVKLTSHEYRLLAYLMHHAGRVVSRTELVEHLYDQDFDRDSNTIEVFVGRIRKKLGVDIIQTVRGLGYLLDAAERVAPMRANSLALRLFVSATAWAVVILLITGIVLSSLYRQAVERAFDRRLGVYLRTLVADVASPDEPNEKFPQSLGEPLFELPLSGWYWQVTRLDPGKHDVRSSRSLWDGGLPHLQDLGVAAGPDGSREGYVPGPEDQQLRLVERNIDLGEEGHYLVAVAGDAAEIDEETRSFDQALVITFSILAVVLLLTTMFQVRFGLAPLKRITDSLAAIRSGNAERLAGQFPEEIAPLARETNALIDANKEIVERARTHVGNLAHALKTPLSVMVNEASARARRSVRQQGARAGRHHARPGGAPSRARAAGGAAHGGRLAHRCRAGGHRAGAHHGEDPPRPRHRHRGARRRRQARFRGERPDLEEMIGNLVDNACKWAASRVAIEVMRERPDAGKRRAGVAHRGRRRRPRALAGRARAGGRARPAARREQAGLRAWAFDRGGTCRALWRRAQARHRAARRPARRTGAAGGVAPNRR